jgi:RNA polymerase sigma-70 factor (ECF subfamily)
MSDARRERLAALFDAHENRLYGLARRLSGSPQDAGDLVQDTFLRAAKSWTSIPSGASKEEAWLVRVLVNICRDRWRRTAVRQRSADALLAHQMRVSPDVESALIVRQAVWRALDTLHPRRRAIVIMCELEGKSPPAIAAMLGVSSITVRWHLSMARRELRHALETFREKGHDDDARASERRGPARA